MRSTAAATFARVALITSCIFASRTPAHAQGIGWDEPSARSAIRLVYLDVLGREPDATGMNDFTRKLVNENMSTQELVFGVINSDEYRTRFIAPYAASENWHPIVVAVYKKLLARAPENEQAIRRHSELLHQGRYSDWLRTIVYSDEYQSKWGYLGVPGVGRVPVRAVQSTAGVTAPSGQPYFFKLVNATSTILPCLTDFALAPSAADAERTVEARWPGYTATPIQPGQYADYATCDR